VVEAAAEAEAILLHPPHCVLGVSVYHANHANASLKQEVVEEPVV
jgi:hypothetical protein